MAAPALTLAAGLQRRNAGACNVDRQSCVLPARRRGTTCTGPRAHRPVDVSAGRPDFNLLSAQLRLDRDCDWRRRAEVAHCDLAPAFSLAVGALSCSSVDFVLSCGAGLLSELVVCFVVLACPRRAFFYFLFV